MRLAVLASGSAGSGAVIARLGTGLPATLVAGLAGGLAALALREAVLASPALVSWLRAALEPLRRAASEGYAPSGAERRRLAVLAAAAAICAGWLLAGPGLALPLAVGGPATAVWAISRGRRRYRRAVELALPAIADAVADSLAAGRSLRVALPASRGSLEGPAATELARLGAELELGAPTVEALAAWRRRMRSPRVDALADALLSQRLAGGDLAGLLRRFGAAAAERDRVLEDARAATAQARFTGMLVVAMPAGGALFAELLGPGFLSRLLGSPPAVALLAAAAALQAAGFLAIGRLSRVLE